MTYRLSSKSLANLKGVHPDLVKVVKLAITLTKADFTVFEGVRTAAQQAVYVRRGVSQTMNGKHLIQPSGFGHAVDLVPFVAGRAQWLWPECYLIASAMKQASEQLEVKVKWGGCWQDLSQIDDPKKAVAAYVNGRIVEGRKAFNDGPHYELNH